MDGIILVNKEKGMTSRDVVNRICKIFNTKKVGHTGTLDPLATGVLAVAINKGLKIVDEITSYDKEYEAEVLLGINTDTLDITGNILEERKVDITVDEIDKVLASFIGDYHMLVPKYSSIKVNGKKLYEYARNNEEVEIPFRDVKVFELSRISDIEKIDDRVSFKIKCKVSKGTYIRSLIRDISNRLGTIGTMKELKRTKQGDFDIKDSYTLRDIENDNYRLLSIKSVLKMPFIEVTDDIINLVKNGNKIDNNYKFDEICFIKNGEVIAIYKKDAKNAKLLRPKKML
ncbi:MAG: tRNA pseudouridine(55) synthase TruB [Bacilli bacterium]|nr:tRNA pseudouridine(55) synthase TruB [Bacilli bacterium]